MYTSQRLVVLDPGALVARTPPSDATYLYYVVNLAHALVFLGQVDGAA